MKKSPKALFFSSGEGTGKSKVEFDLTLQEFMDNVDSYPRIRVSHYSPITEDMAVCSAWIIKGYAVGVAFFEDGTRVDPFYYDTMYRKTGHFIVEKNYLEKLKSKTK